MQAKFLTRCARMTVADGYVYKKQLTAAASARFFTALSPVQNDGCGRLVLQKAADGYRFREILRYAVAPFRMTVANG